MAGLAQPRQDAGQWAGKARLAIAHQLVGVGGVARLVAVAGDDQVIGQRSHDPVQVGDQRLAAPGHQPLVAAAHARALADGQEQDRTVFIDGVHPHCSGPVGSVAVQPMAHQYPRPIACSEWQIRMLYHGFRTTSDGLDVHGKLGLAGIRLSIEVGDQLVGSNYWTGKMTAP
ncbi:hypothetical protein D9M71_541040 [compost metagenome]